MIQYKIPINELGSMSPLLVNCSDGNPSIDNIKIVKPYISLIKKYLEDEEDIPFNLLQNSYSKYEKNILYKMDDFLDLPKVILLKDIPYYEKIKYLTEKKYHNIPILFNKTDHNYSCYNNYIFNNMGLDFSIMPRRISMSEEESIIESYIEEFQIPKEELGSQSPLLDGLTIHDIEDISVYIKLIVTFFTNSYSVPDIIKDEHKKILYTVGLYLDLPKTIHLLDIPYYHKVAYLIQKNYYRIPCITLNDSMCENNKLITDDLLFSNDTYVCILNYMQNKGYWWTCKAFEKACEYGQLELLKWLCKQKHSALNTTAITIAIQKGHLHILKWVKNNRSIWIHNAKEIALKYNHLHIVDWLYENKSTFY